MAMSGGHYNYYQNYIKDITYNIEEVLKYPKDYYIKKDETIQAMKEGLLCLRKAYIYAQRIDWMLSGDDGEDTFLDRLEKELEEMIDEN
jgi:hypothetical protein